MYARVFVLISLKFWGLRRTPCNTHPELLGAHCKAIPLLFFFCCFLFLFLSLLFFFFFLVVGFFSIARSVGGTSRAVPRFVAGSATMPSRRSMWLRLIEQKSPRRIAVR